MKKKKVNQKKEITWNIVNSLLAGVLVLLGSFAGGNINLQSIEMAVVAGLIVAISQFRNYWSNEEQQYSNTKLFGFIK